MREIRFRYWNKHTGKMVENVGFHPQIDFNLAADPNYNYAFGAPMSRIISPTRSGTLMQFTGVKDKNKKEIYEGDIVKLSIVKETGNGHDGSAECFSGYALGEVVIHKRFGVCLKYPLIWDEDEDVLVQAKTSSFKSIASYRSEVVGTIYTHSALLGTTFPT